MIHELKIDPFPFNLMMDKKKTYEVRFNDRGFKTGDKVLLCETCFAYGAMKRDPKTFPLKYTGRSIMAEIVSIVGTAHAAGLKEGYVVLCLQNGKALGRHDTETERSKIKDAAEVASATANKIEVDREEEASGCSCHISPPCDFCVDGPDPDEVEDDIAEQAAAPASLDRKFKVTAINRATGRVRTDAEVIVFVASDDALPATLAFYHEECRRKGSDEGHLKSVELLEDRLAIWRHEHKGLCHVPDMSEAERPIQIDGIYNDDLEGTLEKAGYETVDLSAPIKPSGKKYHIWYCKIAVSGDTELPNGFDAPPRSAAQLAIENAGIEVLGCFSGWAGKLDETEAKVLEEHIEAIDRIKTD